MHLTSRSSRRALGRSVNQTLSRLVRLEALENRVLMSAEMATWSDSFVNSIGVNIKPTGYGYLYSNPTQMETDLKDIGIRNIRGDINWLPDGMNTNISTYAPVRELAMVDTDHKAHSYAEYQTIIQNDLTAIKNEFASHPDRLAGIEGPNELDLQNPDPDWQADIPMINQIAYTLIRGDSLFNGIPYIGCSLGDRSSFQKLEYNGDTSQGQYADAANTHSYLMHFNPGYNAKYSSAELSSATQTYGLPVWMPETGYSTTTATDSNGQPLGMPMDAQARYVLRTFLENFNAGMSRTYWFELADTWNDGDWAGHLGLINMDGTYTYKPSATGLKNMIGRLSDTNNGTSYTAGSLDYSISAPTDIDHTLLQKANGNFELALWQETPYNSDGTRTAGESVTLTLNTPVNSTVTWYNPIDNTSGTLTVNASHQVTLTVNDAPVILEITPSSRPAVPSAPTNVTVSGQGSSTFGVLNWTNSAGTNANGFVVQRSGSDGVWSTLAKTTSTSYVDAGVIPGHSYSYRVWAVNSGGGQVSGTVNYTSPIGNQSIVTMNTATMYSYGNITVSNQTGNFSYCGAPAVAITPGNTNSFISYYQPGLTSFQVTIDGNLWEAQDTQHYSASVSSDGTNWTPVATTVTMGMFGENGRPTAWFLSPSAPLAAGTKYVRFDAAIQDTYSHGFALVKLWYDGSVLPAGWSDSDIGSTGLAGSAGSATGLYTVKGAGADIWGTSDQFNYASTPVAGDQTMIARVTGLTNTNASAKAAIMFRASSATNAPFVLLDVKPAGGIEFMSRATSGGSVTYNGGLGTGVTPSPTTPIWIKLVGSAGTYTAYYATGTALPTTWTAITSVSGISGLSTSGYQAGLAVCSHTTSALATGTFDNVNVLPTGWTDSDIGSPKRTGSAGYANGVYTVNGSGSDIWNTSDQFNFAAQTVSGDQTIIARVTGQTTTAQWAKAGVMLRDSSAANAMNAAVLVTPYHGITFQWRSSTGGSSSNTTVSATVPQYVKLVRSGSNYSAYYSADGVTWTQIGSAQTISFSNSNYLAGLAVTSLNNGSLGAATFSNVSVTPTTTSKLTGTTIGTTGSWSTGNTGLYTAPDGANAVFDGNLNTYFDPWSGSTQGNQWVGLDLGTAKTITAVKVAPRSGYGSRMVGAQIQVSIDGTNWATAYTITSAPADGVLTTYNLNLTGTYRYVRIIGASNQWFNIAEMEVWGC